MTTMTSSEHRTRFRCGNCQAVVRALGGAAGKIGICPGCGERLRVPDPELAEIGAAEWPADPLEGRLLGGDFLVQSKLGAGASGQVYRADQLSLQRIAAVKIMSRDRVPPHRLDRLRREAVALGRVAHPNIIPVFAYGLEDDMCWMAMEFAVGGDLASRVDSGSVTPDRGAGWLRDTLAGLAVAHAHGILHRDIKPQNLLIDEYGKVRIADFGLSISAGDIGRRGGGTPAYVAPELLRGDDADARSDLYNVGATFYHVFTGRLPFEAESKQELLEKRLRESPAPMCDLAPSLSLALTRIVERLMESSPGLRYQTAAAAMADLESYGHTCGFRCEGCPSECRPMRVPTPENASGSQG